MILTPQRIVKRESSWLVELAAERGVLLKLATLIGMTNAHTENGQVFGVIKDERCLLRCDRRYGTPIVIMDLGGQNRREQFYRLYQNEVTKTWAKRAAKPQNTQTWAEAWEYRAYIAAGVLKPTILIPYSKLRHRLLAIPAHLTNNKYNRPMWQFLNRRVSEVTLSKFWRGFRLLNAFHYTRVGTDQVLIIPNEAEHWFSLTSDQINVATEFLRFVRVLSRSSTNRWIYNSKVVKLPFERRSYMS